MLTVVDMITIQTEIMLDQPLSIDTEDAREYRDTLEVEIADLRSDGIEAALPTEWPEDLLDPADIAEATRLRKIMFPNWYDESGDFIGPYGGRWYINGKFVRKDLREPGMFDDDGFPTAKE